MRDVTSSFDEVIVLDLEPLLDEFNEEIDKISVSGLPEGAVFDLSERQIRGCIKKGSFILQHIISIEIALQDGGTVIEVFNWDIKAEDNLNYIPDQHSLIEQSVIIPLAGVIDDNAYIKVVGAPDGISYCEESGSLKGIVRSKINSPVKISVIYSDKSAEVFSFFWHVYDTEQELEDYIHSVKLSKENPSIATEDVRLTSELVDLLDNVVANSAEAQEVQAKSLAKKLLPFGFFAVALIIALFPIQKGVYLPGTLVPYDYTYIEAPHDGVLETYSLKSGESIEEGGAIISYRIGDLQKELDRELLDLRILKGEYQRLIAESNKGSGWELLKALSLSELASKEHRVSELYAMLENPAIVSSMTGLFYLNSSVKRQGDYVRRGEYVGIVSETLQHIQVNISSAHLNFLNESSDFKYHSLPDQQSFYLEVVDISKNLDESTAANYPYRLIARILDVTSNENIGSIGKVEISQGYTPLIAALL